MGYRLKANQPDFETVDGSMPLRKFAAGEIYETIPPEEAHRFDETGAPEEETVKYGGDGE